jgi:phosphopantothenoylcysteine synthetase/decarboxylase
MPATGWDLITYQTFDELNQRMGQKIRKEPWDCIIHSAAVSDYLPAGIFAPEPGTQFDYRTGSWIVPEGKKPTLIDRRAGKVKSDEPELWLRMQRAPKIVDSIRSPWNFRGILVKFKLEVGINETQLLAVAERSRLQSQADLMVANTLEEAAQWALIGPIDGRYQKIFRKELAQRLVQVVETFSKEGNHG